MKHLRMAGLCVAAASIAAVVYGGRYGVAVHAAGQTNIGEQTPDTSKPFNMTQVTTLKLRG